jgi:hypothetical protein
MPRAGHGCLCRCPTETVVHHQASLALFLQFDKSSGCCGAHGLVQVFSTLARMPGKHRISGVQAMLFVGCPCLFRRFISRDQAALPTRSNLDYAS